MREMIAALCLALVACGGSDGPTGGSSPIAVRITSAAIGSSGDAFTVSIVNQGGTGQYRIVGYDDASPGTYVGQPRQYFPRRRCVTTPALINPGVSATLSYACDRVALSWIVVESQDGASVDWIRTACYAAADVPAGCVADVKPQR